MANDDVMGLDKQIGRLEDTVAREFSEQAKRVEQLEVTVRKGFEEFIGRFDRQDARHDGHDSRSDRLEGRMGRLEDRMHALENKLDVVADSIRGDIKTVLRAVTNGTEEMRRTTDAIRKEHQADPSSNDVDPRRP
jgi:glutamyl-tRNA reductase